MKKCEFPKNFLYQVAPVAPSYVTVPFSIPTIFCIISKKLSVKGPMDHTFDGFSHLLLVWDWIPPQTACSTNKQFQATLDGERCGNVTEFTFDYVNTACSG